MHECVHVRSAPSDERTWKCPFQVLSRQAVLVRAQFEANRSVSNLAEAETLVAAGEKRCVHVCSWV